MKKLMIIDGNSILNRAYYGIRMLNAPDGTPTNAVYGFLNILFKNLDEDMPDYLCVAFDVKEKTFRHKMYELYKAQRKPAPEDFLVQLPLMKEVLRAMNCTCLELPGYEADDIIGTVSKICEEQGVECSILTGDKDDLQLASELVHVKLVVTRMGTTSVTVYGADEVYEKYRVTPKEFIDVKGLMGDTSDNIPGVKGIGEKTAFSLIERYKSIDNIYSQLDGLEVTPSVRKKLAEGREQAQLSRTLAEIDRNVPIEFSLEECKLREGNRAELARLFMRLNFRSFMTKLNLTAADAAAEDAAAEDMPPVFDGKCIAADRAEIIELINASKNAAYRLRTDGGGITLGITADGESFYRADNADDELLRAFFENEKCGKIGFNIKEDILFLKKRGIEYRGIDFDDAVAAYILEPTRSAYDIDGLAMQYMGMSVESGEFNEDENGQLSLDFSENRVEDGGDGLAAELFAVFGLRKKFAETLEKNGQSMLYYDVELPLVEVLADMQYTGVYVDRGELIEFGKRFKNSIHELESRIYSLAGTEFNINSPKQLGDILFVNLQLPHGKKTKTGYSTGADVLKKLSGVHPIIDDILEYRALTKLQSTYVEGLLAVINDSTGRIHSNFNQTVTATGRISSTEPNLQNIPVRTARGREMRRLFAAENGRILIDADYSQIELRVLAHVADDENMRSAFINGTDIHTQTAAQVFRVPVSEVTPEMRSGAKAVNFGIVYGIGEFSLAQDLKISIKEARQYIENYLATYPSIKKYMERTVAEGRANGYVSTILGRRRYLPELRASNKITQAFGERVAMNAPIQGSAADIIKIAMVNVYRRLKEEKLRAKLILQVHDELIVEAEPEERERAELILKTEMENAIKLSVPLKVDMNSGKTWYDTK